MCVASRRILRKCRHLRDSFAQIFGSIKSTVESARGAKNETRNDDANVGANVPRAATMVREVPAGLATSRRAAG